jgi:hypothetical protein
VILLSFESDIAIRRLPKLQAPRLRTPNRAMQNPRPGLTTNPPITGMNVEPVAARPTASSIVRWTLTLTLDVFHEIARPSGVAKLRSGKVQKS